MTDIGISIEHRRLAHARAASIQTYARIAGVLSLISLVAGGFGEFFVPTRLLVSADAAATAHNIIASNALFRWGFAGYLLEAMCDVGLTLVLYALLRPVHENLALLAVFFRLVGTAVFGFAELFYFAPALILRDASYLKTFSPDQLNTLALLSLKLYGVGGGIFLVFYGVPSIILGYLIVRSGYLPKFLGVLLALAGVGFVISNFVRVLAPAYASSFLLLPVILAVVSMTAWFLVKGVDVAKWEESAARSLLG